MITYTQELCIMAEESIFFSMLSLIIFFISYVVIYDLKHIKEIIVIPVKKWMWILYFCNQMVWKTEKVSLCFSLWHKWLTGLWMEIKWVQSSLKYFPRNQWPFYWPILTLPLGKNLQENKQNPATGSISFCQRMNDYCVPHVLRDLQPSLFFCFDERLITQKGLLCGQVFWNENKSCRNTVLNQDKSQTHKSSDVH